MIIIYLLIPFIVYAIFYFLSVLIPGKKLSNQGKYNLTTLKAKHQKFATFLLVGFFIFTPILIYLISNGIYDIYLETITANIGQNRYTAVNSIAIFIVPTIFLGIILYLPLSQLMTLLYRYTSKTTKTEMDFYMDHIMQEGFGGNSINGKKLTFWLLSLTTLIISPFYILSFNTYAYVTESEIIINDFLGVEEKRYKFDEVTNIEYYQKESTYYKVTFSDGYEWSTLNYSLNLHPQEQEMIKFIATNSQKEIEYTSSP